MENAAKIIEAQKQILFQHDLRTTKGYIAIAKKETDIFIQRYCRPNELVGCLNDVLGEDVFYSQNTFYRRSRRIETIKQLRSLYVDVDFYVFNYDPVWIKDILQRDYYRSTIPEPNMIIYSGQGIVLIWTIEPVPCTVLPLWQAVQRYLVRQLKDIGGDPKASDAARIFRLAGSTSSKNGKEVYVEYRHDYRYTLREIQKEYLPDLTPKKTIPKRGRSKKIIHLFNVFTLHNARIHDLDTLVTMREGKMTGHRETTLFLYRYWCCCFINDPQEALRQTIEFNQRFTQPLREREVIKATASAQKAWEAKSDKEASEKAQAMGYPGAGYRISNEKIISWLEITPDEQKNLKTIIGKEEKRRRNTIAKRESRRKNGIRPREKYLKEQKTKTESRKKELERAMKEDATASCRKIARKMGVSEAYVRKLKAKTRPTG